MGNKFLIVLVVVLFFCACPASRGTVHFNDGLVHDIDYEINEHVFVDWQAPGTGTTVNWLDGGSIHDELRVFENSRINVCGGKIEWMLASYDTTLVNISGGSVFAIDSLDFSWVNISGGLIDGFIRSQYLSQVNISGGQISGELILYDQCMIQIFGSDFTIDGIPFGYGELTSIFGGNPYNEPWRYLTGTLLSGELIDNRFIIGEDARMVLIPEPASVLLLGLGGLALLKKRRI